MAGNRTRASRVAGENSTTQPRRRCTGLDYRLYKRAAHLSATSRKKLGEIRNGDEKKGMNDARSARFKKRIGSARNMGYKI